jgi:hypothetical protein
MQLMANQACFSQHASGQQRLGHRTKVSFESLSAVPGLQEQSAGSGFLGDQLDCGMGTFFVQGCPFHPMLVRQIAEVKIRRNSAIILVIGQQPGDEG